MVRITLSLIVKASSLVEVTIAMVIFVLILGLSFGILLKVSTSGFSEKQLRFDMLAAAHAKQIKANKKYFDDVVELEGAYLYREISSYNESILMLEINIISQSSDTISRYRELLYDSQ